MFRMSGGRPCGLTDRGSLLLGSAPLFFPRSLLGAAAPIVDAMNRHKTILWLVWTISGGFLLLCILTSFLARQLPPPSPLSTTQLPPPLVTVSFVGYSNAANHQTFAQFALSNLTQLRVVVQRPTPITCSNGQWSIMSAAGQPLFLRGGERKVISVPKPTRVEAWRLPIFHGPIPSRLVLGGVRLWQALPWKPDKLNQRIELEGSTAMRLAESEVLSDE